MPEPVVHFINSTDPSLPKPDGVRALIRKQAMKHVAQTRRTSRPKKKGATTKDSEGAPQSEQSTRAPRSKQLIKPPQPEEVLKAETGIYKLAFENLNILLPTIPKPPNPTGYTSIRSKYGIDVADLSMLTTFHVGRSTIGMSKEILGMKSMLRAQIPSYMAELPKLYGKSKFLDASLECLLARMQTVIIPSADSDEEHILSTYYKAIKGLQTVLEDPKEQKKPETLAAVSLLSLFEIVDEYNPMGWKQHADGAAMLIQMRGPVEFETEFEKSLFESQIGPLITEALLDNKACFLESDSWDKTFNSIQVEGELNLRSPIIIRMRRIFTIMPGIFADATHIVCSDARPESDHILSILARCYKLRADLRTWRSEMEDFTKSFEPTDFQRDLIAEVIATYLGLVLILDRVIASLDFGQLQTLEKGVLNLCSQLIAMEQLNLPESPHLLLFVRQKGKIAHSIFATSGDWLAAEARPVENYPPGIAPSPIFIRWCQIIKRKVT